MQLACAQTSLLLGEYEISGVFGSQSTSGSFITNNAWFTQVVYWKQAHIHWDRVFFRFEGDATETIGAVGIITVGSNNADKEKRDAELEKVCHYQV